MILRNPIDVMYSLHASMLYREAFEDIEDFEEALKMEKVRKKEAVFKIAFFIALKKFQYLILRKL